MKDALFTPTPEQIAERQKPYRDDLARWPDMHQMPEPEERGRWNPVAVVVLTYAAAICVVVAWVVAARVL